MYGANFAHYYDHGDYAIVNLAVLRQWIEFLTARHTLVELASASGISRTTIWRFLKGKRITPQSAYFLALGCLDLVKQHEATAMGLDNRFGTLMEVQTALF